MSASTRGSGLQGAEEADFRHVFHPGEGCRNWNQAQDKGCAAEAQVRAEESRRAQSGGLRAVIKWSLGRGPWKEGRRPLRTCCCKRNTTQPKIRHPGRSLSEGFYHSSRISNTTHLTKNISPPYLPLRPVGQASAPAAGVFITGWTPRLLIGWLVRKMPQDMNVNVQFPQIH